MDLLKEIYPKKELIRGHYSPLLETESSIDDPEEEIQAVFSNFEISDELFTASEHAKVKVSLKRGQSGGIDDIPPNVYIECEWIMQFWNFAKCYS